MGYPTLKTTSLKSRLSINGSPNMKMLANSKMITYALLHLLAKTTEWKTFTSTMVNSTAINKLTFNMVEDRVRVEVSRMGLCKVHNRCFCNHGFFSKIRKRVETRQNERQDGTVDKTGQDEAQDEKQVEAFFFFIVFTCFL